MNHQRSVTSIIFFIAMVFGGFQLGYGQSSTGTLNGTITDASGALVPNATVEILNLNTGEKRTATTGDNGSYAVSTLSAGKYTITATATGFAQSTAKDVSVSVSFPTTVNLTLNAAGAAETVIVTGGDTQTQVNFTDQQLSTLIDNRKIIDLPLLSRNPDSLIGLAPGTVQANSALGGFSVNGARERNNNFLVDGIDNNDAQVPGGPGGVGTPNIDATQEFRVITNSFNAEYGRNTGGIINIVSKGGSNDFHGNAYIYYRSDRFAARDFFDVSGHADPLQRRQFGSSIGGPILKDKLFFFTNYEGDRESIGSQVLRTVPSASARKGILETGSLFGTIDLSKNSPNNNSGAALSDVYGTEGIPNVGLNPAVLQLLSLYPAGNSPADDPLPGVLEAYRFAFVNKNRSNSSDSRVDWVINSKHSLTGSYHYAKGVFNDATTPETFPGLGDALITPQTGHRLALVLTSTLSPRFVNELRFGGNRSINAFNTAGEGGVATTVTDAINSAFSKNGVPLALPFGGSNGQAFNLTTSSVSNLGLTFSGVTPIDAQFRFAGTTDLGDTFTYIRGAHTFKAGVERRWVYFNGADNFGRSETLNFDFPSLFGESVVIDNNGEPISPFTGQGGLINNYASFLFGLVGQQTQSQYFNPKGQRVDQDYRGMRNRDFEAFVQDTWKVRPNLTLNYGLRYDFRGVPYEVNGQLSTLVDQDPSSKTPDGGFVFKLVGKKSANPNLKLWDNDYNNFAPRVGFNYSPNFQKGLIARLTGGPTKTSLRGGYGIYYDRVFGNLFTNAKGNPPFQQDFLNYPVDILQNVPRPETLVSSPVVKDGAQVFPVLFALPGNNPFQQKFSTPYQQKWNFGFQRELGTQFLLEADYVGSKGTHELRVLDGTLSSVPRVNALTGANLTISKSPGVNAQNGRLSSAFSQVATNLAIGFSTYHAMQLRVTKTLTNKSFGTGQIQGAYTWSHQIDNAEDPLVGQGAEATRTNPRDSSGYAGGWSRPERGNSGYDTRHRFVLNFLYDLPIRFENRWLDRTIGNWTMTGIWFVQSGHPFSVFGNTDSAGTGFSQRANFATNGNGLAPTPANLQNPRTQTGPTRDQFTNPLPPPKGSTFGIQGNVPRGAFVGPGFNEFDYSVIKRFPVNEKYRFSIRADFFNLFNRANFSQPVNTINSLNFGQSTQTYGLSRTIQFAARFDF